MNEASREMNVSFRAKYLKTPDRKLKNTSTTNRNSSGRTNTSSSTRIRSRRSRNLSPGTSSSHSNNNNILEEEVPEENLFSIQKNKKKKKTEDSDEDSDDDGISLETIRRRLYSSFSSPSSSRSNNSSFFGSPIFSSIKHNTSSDSILLNNNSSADEMYLKEEVMQRIKDNFHLETQALRTRIKDATEETSKAREKILLYQQELTQLKSKCHELTEIINQKDQTIAEMSEKQTRAFPTLMYDTIRRIEQIQEQDLDDQVPQQEQVSKERIDRTSTSNSQLLYAYECQMTNLYQELETSKQKNDMLKECLTIQKQRTKKYKNSCQYTKQEMVQLTNQLTNQHVLLQDFQLKFISFNKLQEKYQMLIEEIYMLNEHKKNLLCELNIVQKSNKKKDEKLEKNKKKIFFFQEQLIENQVRIEHLQSDLFNLQAQNSTNNDSWTSSIKDSQKIKPTMTTSEKETLILQPAAVLAKLEQKIEQLSRENLKMKQELNNNKKEQIIEKEYSSSFNTIHTEKHKMEQEDTITTNNTLNTCNRLKNLLENANGLHKQLNHVKELIKNVIQNETGGGNMFDLELLLQGCILEGREQIEDKSIQHISSSHGEQKVHVQVVQQTIDFYIEHSQKSLGESALCLEELQSLVEEALPHLIGNNCALQ